MPSSNSLICSGPLMRRQVFSASSISLNARPRKVGRDTQLRVRVVRWRTVANVDSIGSFEYAVAVLGTPLILVLGHSKCGAVDAAVKSVKDGKEFPGQIPSLIEAIRPAVKAAQNQPGDLLENAIRQNVVLNVAKLKAASPILSNAVQGGKLKVAGGIYSLETGRVTLIA